MSTQQNLLTIIILWFCVLSNFWSQVSAARYVNVAFPSNATSGNLILHGTIVYPSSDPPATGYIPAILIGGSGPGNRWLNTTSSFLSTSLVGNRPTLSYQPWNFCYVSNEIVSPYYDITTHLADTANMAVLTWDKRTCTIFQKCEGKSCGCQTVPCTLPNQQNCLEINKILNTDFIEDSINALNYLLFTQTYVKVNVNEAAVMGHSAGTTQAPIVALNLTSKYVKKVALIAGPAAPIMTTLSRQYSTSLVQNLAWVNGSLCNMSIPGEANLINALARGIPADMATIENINQENALLQSGYYDNDDPFTPVTIIGATLPLLFWQQAISLSSYNSTSYYINSYLQQSSTTSLLAMNSDQDFNVSPFEFLPLGTIIQGAQSFATPSRVGQVVIPFLTHLQIDSSNLSNHVAPEPLAVLQCYFTSTDLLNCASQISKAESRSKSLLHHPGQPNDKFVDNIFVRTNNLI